MSKTWGVNWCVTTSPYPSPLLPQPSRIGEGVNIGGQSGVSPEIDCHPELVSGSHKMQQHTGQSDVQKMLKRIQHDVNLLKRTYSLINLFSYIPRKRCAFTLAEVFSRFSYLVI